MPIPVVYRTRLRISRALPQCTAPKASDARERVGWMRLLARGDNAGQALVGGCAPIHLTDLRTDSSRE
jgi:hypothetical protein